jgi:hypothetical protein
VSNLPNSECSDNKSLILDSSMRGNMLAGGKKCQVTEVDCHCESRRNALC